MSEKKFHGRIIFSVSEFIGLEYNFPVKATTHEEAIRKVYDVIDLIIDQQVNWKTKTAFNYSENANRRKTIRMLRSYREDIEARLNCGEEDNSIRC